MAAYDEMNKRNCERLESVLNDLLDAAEALVIADLEDMRSAEYETLALAVQQAREALSDK